MNTLGVGALFVVYTIASPSLFQDQKSHSMSLVVGDGVVVAFFAVLAHLPVIAVNVAVGCALWRVGPGRANRVLSLVAAIVAAGTILGFFGATDGMRQALHELYLGEGVVLLFPVLSALALASPCILRSGRDRLRKWVGEPHGAP